MKRFGVFLCALILSFGGCAAPGDKGQFDEFWKDLRGDNMKMRNDFTTGADDSSASPRSRN